MRPPVWPALLLLLLAPVVAAQPLQANTPPVAFVQLRSPHLLALEGASTSTVEVTLAGTVDCAPGFAAPDPVDVYVTYGRGYAEGDLQVFEFGPGSVQVPWVEAGDGEYRIDAVARFELTSEGLPAEDFDHAVVWELQGEGLHAGSCTGTGYQLLWGQAQSAIVIPAAEGTASKDSPGLGLGLLLIVGVVAVLARRRR